NLPASPGVQVFADSLGDAGRIAVDPQAAVADRAQAIRHLAHADPARTRDTFRGLLDVRQPAEVQLAAVRALRATRTADVPALPLERWRARTRAVRAEVVNPLAGWSDWAPALLDAVADGRVPPADLDAPRRNLLLKHPEAKVRDRAERLFGAAKTPR